MNNKYTFPQYRKYVTSTTYFKIESERRFIEISFIGTKSYSLAIDAIQYPEVLRIMDMLDCKDGIWISITKEEFETIKM